MDILTLGLGAVKTNQEESPEAAAPGFDAALNEAQISSGGIPPGGPPGPEPPPGISPAGEGVTSNEPNALSKELDFLPQADLNIETPEALLASGNPEIKADADTDKEATSNDSDLAPEALEWMASQMTGGFFATPIVSVPAEVPVVVAKPELSPVAVVQIEVTKPVLSAKESFGNRAHGDDSGDKTISGIPPICPMPDVEVPSGNNLRVPGTGVPGNENPDVEIVMLPKDDGNPDNSGFKLVNGPDLEIQGFQVHPVLVEETTQTVDIPAANPVQIQTVASTDPIQKTRPEKVATEAGAGPTQAERPTLEAKVERTETKSKTTSETKAESKSAEGEPTPVAEATTLASSSDSKSGSKKESELKQPHGIEASESKPIAVGKISDEPLLEAITADKTEVAQTEVIENGAATVSAGKSVTVAKDEPKLAAGEVSSVVKQVSDRLQMLAAARPKQGVTIHLSPEDFGNITVVVKSIGQQVEAQLFASDERVREALDQNHSRLTEAMDRRGYQLQAVTVSSQTNHSTHQDAPKQQAQSNDQQTSSQDRPSHSHGHGGQKGQAQEFNDRPVRASAWAQKKEGVDLSI